MIATCLGDNSDSENDDASEEDDVEFLKDRGDKKLKEYEKNFRETTLDTIENDKNSKFDGNRNLR
jgi:hypothetical protein